MDPLRRASRAAWSTWHVVLLCMLVPLDALAQRWQFTDVTSAAGFDYEHGYVDGAGSEVRRMMGGVAAADYDGDGWVDVYVVRGDIGPNLLFRNRGDGTFEEVGAAAGVDVAGAICSGPAFADYDGDGLLDLFMGGAEGAGPRLFRNRGDGRFADVTATCGIEYRGSTFGATFGDYDRDGDLDLFMTHWGSATGGTGHLWRNEGDGTFSDADQIANVPQLDGRLDFTFSPNFADFNNDGWPDLALASDFGTSQLYLNNRNGTFGKVPIGPLDLDENGMGAAIGDYENDGDLDWFVSSIWDADGDPEGNWGVTGNRLYRNRGDGRFEDATDVAGVRAGDWGWGCSFADFNNDGLLDLVLVNGWHPAPFDSDPARLFVADGERTFVERGVELGTDSRAQGRGVACFDFDRDGDLDLFIANNSGAPLLLRNDGGNRSSWLSVKLRGNAPNSEAVGARVQVTVNGVTQMRELRIGCNYVSQNPVEAHFGLGRVDRVDELRITFPEGEVLVLHDVPANQRLVLDPTLVPVEIHDLAAESVEDGVLLRWRLAPDFTHEVSGVRVQRAASAAGPYASITRSALQASESMAYVDTSAVDGTSYGYRLVLETWAGALLHSRTLFVVAGEGTASGLALLPPVRASADRLVVRYHLDVPVQRLRLGIYDVAGRSILDLASGRRQPGTHAAVWDLQSDFRPARGVYLLRLRADGVTLSRKLILHAR